MNIDKYLVSEKTNGNDIANFIRNSLSGTPRKTTGILMFHAAKEEFKDITKNQFTKVWNELVRDEFLVKVSGKSYKWER